MSYLPRTFVASCSLARIADNLEIVSFSAQFNSAGGCCLLGGRRSKGGCHPATRSYGNDRGGKLLPLPGMLGVKICYGSLTIELELRLHRPPPHC
jgi:hypothetical protein